MLWHIFLYSFTFVGHSSNSFLLSLVCAPCLRHRWNKNPTLSQNHNLPIYRPTYLSNFLLTYVLLFLPPRLLYLLSHFLLSHYPPYLPSHYFSQKPPLTFPKPQLTHLSTDPPTYQISYLPMCFFSYLPGSCTYFLISCFLTTHLTYLLTISLKNHPLPTYLPTCLLASLSGSFSYLPSLTPWEGEK